VDRGSVCEDGNQENLDMGWTMRLYLKARELGKHLRKGQTMTEYALILAAVAIVVFVVYEVMGQDIGKLVNNVDSALTTT
jgi:Flp pilus assembly pilin Flp